MIHTQALHKRYGTQVALHALDLSVNAGEVYCLLGANGAGKTTTLNVLLGFTVPDGGSALLAGSPPAAGRVEVATIAEQVALYPTLTGLENLSYFAGLAGRKLAQEESMALLLQAGLSAEAASRPLGGYSKGMRQKVGIAIALAKQAKVLLLDEPMSGLDPQAANEFVGLVATVAKGGAAVLMATHDLFRVRQMATRIGILRGGKKLAEFEAASLDAQQLQALYLQYMES
jgi:ABC-2 type transport system ATP-binding protein